jgi:hypothetical protein
MPGDILPERHNARRLRGWYRKPGNSCRCFPKFNENPKVAKPGRRMNQQTAASAVRRKYAAFNAGTRQPPSAAVHSYRGPLSCLTECV